MRYDIDNIGALEEIKAAMRATSPTAAARKLGWSRDRVLRSAAELAKSLARMGRTHDTVAAGDRDDRDTIRPRVGKKTWAEWSDPVATLGDYANERASHESPGWMDVLVIRPRLVRPHANAARHRDEGAALVAPWRATADGRVFSQRVGRPTGSLLVDASGSMHFGQEDLERIIDAVPAATVAIYSSLSHGRFGQLCIVAHDGRRAENGTWRLDGKWNGIDGPALRWLALQRRPRVWISDGSVSGNGDITHPALSLEALHICQQHRIHLVGDVRAALAVL